MEFEGDIARKRGEPSLLAVEAAKASRALEIGKHSGLFRVPRVINLDAETGVLEFERLRELATLLDLAVRKDARLPGLLEKAGRALAAVHEELTLPEDMKVALPSIWMCRAGENVCIHGDFACINVCVDESSDELVILDWSAAPIVGRTPNRLVCQFIVPGRTMSEGARLERGGNGRAVPEGICRRIARDEADNVERLLVRDAPPPTGEHTASFEREKVVDRLVLHLLPNADVRSFPFVSAQA